jgi:hypothetical protein
MQTPAFAGIRWLSADANILQRPIRRGFSGFHGISTEMARLGSKKAGRGQPNKGFGVKLILVGTLQGMSALLLRFFVTNAFTELISSLALDERGPHPSQTHGALSKSIEEWVPQPRLCLPNDASIFRHVSQPSPHLPVMLTSGEVNC